MMGFFSKKEDKKEAAVQPTTDYSTPIRPEVRRAPRPAGLMTEQQLTRVQEAKRLAETKLKNTEDSLAKLHEQQEWLRQYNKLKLELEHEKAHLYELNKQQAGLTDTRQALERFETFENIQGDFLRMQMLNEATNQNKRDRSQLDHDMEETHKQWEEQQKRQHQYQDARQLAEDHLHQAQDAMADGNHMSGQIEQLEIDIHQMEEKVALEKLELGKADQDIEAHQAEIEQLEYELERHRAGRQSMEPYEQMIQHGERILLQLDVLKETRDNLEVMRAQQEESNKRQNDENEMLGKTFSQYQDIEAQIQSLTDEIHVHRVAIKGQDSFHLQERAMRLKSEHQMLLSAQSLWNRISTGYTTIEAKTIELNDLKLKIDHAEANERQLDTKASSLRTLCHEKEYTYLLSKSQNVIQLRGDLKEGVSCSVCGATHHPYHSDTMLEQSKLIGEFKTEYEQLAAESLAQEKALQEERLTLASLRASQLEVENTLADLRQRQYEDVQEWDIFASLDKSFVECSTSTNLEARQSMLRQLIENTKRDAEEAQQELEAFTFHQNSINEISEKIAAMELRKSELNTRLNEINTGCQVMAGQTDRIKAMISSTNDRYSHMYEEVDKVVSINDWLKEWKQSHEGLKMRIQKLMEGWAMVNRKITDEQEELKVEKALLKGCQTTRAAIQKHIEDYTNRIEACNNRIHELKKQQEQELGDTDARTQYVTLYEQLIQARRDELAEKATTDKLQQQLDYMRGSRETHIKMGEQLSESYSKKQQELDIWIHDFNAQNPPVQYAELERVFMENRDWSATRQKVRDIQLASALSQARVNDLSSRLIALQAEGGRASVDEEATLQASLISQRESLERKRYETMLQIARLTIQLEEHEKAQHQKVEISIDNNEGNQSEEPSI